MCLQAGGSSHSFLPDVTETKSAMQQPGFWFLPFQRNLEKMEQKTGIKQKSSINCGGWPLLPCERGWTRGNVAMGGSDWK